jgi:ketosteroid isomerase-like protein
MGLMGLLTGCAQFGTGGSPSVNLEAEQTSIRNADMEWSKAATAKNIDQVVSYYAEDASVFVPNEQIATGIPAIKSEWTKMMALPGFSVNWIPTRVDVAKSGDMGYSFGNYNLTVSDPTGKPMNDRGKYVVVWKKQTDGKWKAEADIFNSDLPPPSANQAPASAPTSPAPPA